MHALGQQPERDTCFPAADVRTQEEVGGLLERAFRREGGEEPREEEKRRLLARAEEAEARAAAAESQAREAEWSGERAAERYGRSGSGEYLASLRDWQEQAEARRREAEELRGEAERLRHYA